MKRQPTDRHHPQPAGKPRAGCPEWTELPEAAKLFLRGVSARAAGPVALVVGTLLSAVNQGTVVLSGAATASTWAQVAFNYVVPFMVSSLGYLAAGRVPPRHRDRILDEPDRTIGDERDRPTHPDAGLGQHP